MNLPEDQQFIDDNSNADSTQLSSSGLDLDKDSQNETDAESTPLDSNANLSEHDMHNAANRAKIYMEKTSTVSSIDSVDGAMKSDIDQSASSSRNEAVESSLLTVSQESNATSSTSSTVGSRRSFVQERLDRAKSFVSGSSSGTNGKRDKPNANSTNLPSTFVSAISSLTSSFASSFSLSNPSNMNGSNVSASDAASNNLMIETATNSSRSSQHESKNDVFSRKATLERKNLINLTKLIVKDLISTSLVSGRTIENECQSAIHLNNYFTLIDRVLKHGLKQNILTNRSASLWNVLDGLSKYLKESTLMSESIRSLEHTKTADGKIKAWMRLAMMQKKLPEYFNELLAQKDVLLKDIYHDYAFMLCDEAHVFAGLIIGINVIDCNFFVKDNNFDLMDDIIDLGPYLRAASSHDEESDEQNYATNSCENADDERSAQLRSMSKVLDQKNYLEEYNKHLESTISNLHTKIRMLEEQNSSLEMEAKVSEARIAKLEENRKDISLSHAMSSNNDFGVKSANTTGLPIQDAIKSIITRNKSTISDEYTQASSQIKPIDTNKSGDITFQQTREIKCDDDVKDASSDSKIIPDAKHLQNSAASDEAERKQAALVLDLDTHRAKVTEQCKEIANLRERISILESSYRSALDKIRILERDLDIQTSMNCDKETTIKIYEKDIRDKQQQVESLRASLVDAKKLNSELNERFIDTSNKLKDRLMMVSQLQANLDKWKLENKSLAARLQDRQQALSSANNNLEKSLDQIKELKKYNEKVNDELRRERESGQSSSVTVEEQNTRITELVGKVANYERELKSLSSYRDQYQTLKERCQEYEQSLEEVGAQLRESRLEVENLKENSSVFLDSQWMDSKQVKQCALCQQSFSVTRRKHHCRLCGNVFCQTCSDNKMELASSSKPARVCDTCHAFLLAKFVKSASSSTTAITLPST